MSPRQGPARWNNLPASLWITDIIRERRKLARTAFCSFPPCRASRPLPLNSTKFYINSVLKSYTFSLPGRLCLVYRTGEEMADWAEPGLDFSSLVHFLLQFPKSVRPDSSCGPEMSPLCTRAAAPYLSALVCKVLWQQRLCTWNSFQHTTVFLFFIETRMGLPCSPWKITPLGGCGLRNPGLQTSGLHLSLEIRVGRQRSGW